MARNLPKLTSVDVQAILDLRAWVAKTEYEERCQKIRALEGRLSEAARVWWYNATTDDLDAELRRWRPAYRVEKTRAGYRVFRLLKTRGVYRLKPSKTGLSAEDVKEYREFVRI